MNFAAWIDFDLELCGRLCLVLAHSLWQIALLAALATLIVRNWKNAPPERIYTLYAAALLLGLLALPITFTLTRLPGESIALREAITVPQQQISPAPNAPSERQMPVQQAMPPVVASVPPALSTTAQRPLYTTATSLLSWAPWLVGCYVVGVTIMLLRLIRSLWQNYRLAAQATPITSGPFVETLQRLARIWSLRVTPVLACTERLVVPQVVGLWRPTILLPAAALAGLRPDELEMIIAHELAHVRRYDLWMNLVQRLAEAVLFFNPAVWFLSRQISLYREYCCDEATCQLARRTADDTRLRYAEALLRAVELTKGAGQSQKLAALAASGSRPSELRRRVARLFGEPLREPVRISRSALVTLLVGVTSLAMIPIARQNAAETESEAKPAKDVAKPTVEVVAIGTHDEEPQRWWDAKGKLLEDVPFTWRNELGEATTGDELWRRVVIRVDGRIKNSPEDRVWEVINAITYTGGAVVFGNGLGAGTYLARAYRLDDATKSFDLRVGIAQGSWKTAARRNSSSIIFSDRISTAQGVEVVVSHNVNDKAYRIVAVDKQGITHESVRSGGIGGGGVSQTRGTFPGLTIDDIDHFEFQTRDYEWTEIKDLPVEPEEKTAQTPAKSRLAVREVKALTSEADVEQAQRDRRTNVMSWSPREGGREVISWRDEAPLLTEADVAEAEAVKSDLGGGRFDIQLKLNPEAGERFAKETERLLKANATGVQLAIIFDHQVLMTPRLMSVIRDSFMISGQFDEAKAKEIAGKIKPRSTAKPEPQSTARSMRVKVFDADGQPLQGVEIFRNHGYVLVDGERTKFEDDTYLSDESGETMIPLSGKTKGLRLWARTPGYTPLFADWDEEYQTDGGQIPATFEFRLKRGTKISGVVTNVAGIPVAGAKVEVVAELDSGQQQSRRPVISGWLAYGPAGVLTDSEGCWSLDNVPTDEELVVGEEDGKNQHKTSLRLRFSHPDYETIDGIEDWQTVWNPSLELLRDGTARTVMKWVDKKNHGRVNAVRLEQGEQYRNANLSGRYFKGQEIMVLSDNKFAEAKLAGSTWEDMEIPGGSRLLYEADLSNAKLINVQLLGRSSGLQRTNFYCAELESANLSGGVAGLQQANFDQATITNCDLTSGASGLQEVSFRGATLHSSMLKGEGGALQMAHFDNAQLVKTTISCDSPTAFQGVTLNNTEFIECDLSSINAEALVSCKFESSTPPRYDAKTKFPEGFDPQEHGWTEIDKLPVNLGEKVAVEPPYKEDNHEESNGLASEKIAALEELLASYEAMYERTETLHSQGLAGGEPTKKWLALYHLSMTRAELAKARGETAQALQHYDEAIEAADEMIHSAQALHKAGRGTSESVFEGEVLRTKAKLAKIEAQERSR